MYTPLPFQQEAAVRMRDTCTLLADDCGLGKTITTAKAMALSARGPILIVAPSIAKLWWDDVLHSMFPRLRVTLTGPAGSGLPGNDPQYGDVWVTHPEALVNRRHAQELASVLWDIIIIDEAHRFKNRKAKRTKALWKIRSRVRWALTATPYGRNPGDMWALLHWLYPKEWTSYWRFYNTYVDSFRPSGYGYDIVKGPKNLDRLGELIAPYFIRRTAEDVGVQLPPVSVRCVPVEMTPQESEMYTRLRRDQFISWGPTLGDDLTTPNKLTLMLRLQQLAADPHLIVPYAGLSAKQVWLREWLSDHPDEGVVVASRFKDVTDWPEFDEWAKITGDVPARQRATELDKFNRTGRLVGTLDTISETLNLQRANNIIVLSGTWKPDTMYQMQKRIERIGQVRHCTIYWLLATLRNRKSTVDHIIHRVVDKRLTEAEMLAEFANHLEDEDE